MQILAGMSKCVKRHAAQIVRLWQNKNWIPLLLATQPFTSRHNVVKLVCSSCCTMIYTTIDNFYLTDEALENSPSRRDGIDRDTENTLRMYGCELIQEAGILLAFEQAVMATAQVLFHRFYCKRSMKAFNVKVRRWLNRPDAAVFAPVDVLHCSLQKVAATALWEGAKLEEVKEVSTEPGLLLRMVMIAIDRCTARREMPEGRKLPVLDLHSKVTVGSTVLACGCVPLSTLLVLMSAWVTCCRRGRSSGVR